MHKTNVNKLSLDLNEYNYSAIKGRCTFARSYSFNLRILRSKHCKVYTLYFPGQYRYGSTLTKVSD